MNKLFIILIIAGPALVENVFYNPRSGSEPVTSPPLPSGSFLKRVGGCLKKQNFSQSIKEEISAEMNNCTTTSSCTNLRIIENLARVICITDKNKTLFDLIHCIAMQVDFTLSETGNCIGEFYYSCAFKLRKNSINTLIKCDGFANNFYSLLEFILSIMQGKSYPIENLLSQVAIYASKIARDCYQNLDLLIACLIQIPPFEFL